MGLRLRLGEEPSRWEISVDGSCHRAREPIKHVKVLQAQWRADQPSTVGQLVLPLIDERSH